MSNHDPFISSLLAFDPEESRAPRQELPFELRPLSDESLRGLKRLAKYRPPRDSYPMKARAAVMVALFASRQGALNVLVTTRSSTMRTYAGESALPGGKLEPDDLDLEYTARREAFEECGVPMDTQKVRKLTTLQPFLSRTEMIVTPIVCYIADQSLTPILNETEVSHLFSHPLHAFLTATPPAHLLPKLPVDIQREPQRYLRHWELPWFSDNPYRLFRFQSKASPIVGFTADVLLETAVIAYGRQPSFQRYSEGQLPMSRIIELSLENMAEEEAKTERRRQSRL